MASRVLCLVVFVVLLFCDCSNVKSRFIDSYYTCEMGFFVSSTSIVANGGVAAADEQCQTLSTKVGDCGKRPWRAYLSSSTSNARDRIGKGPWYNVAGQLFAADIPSLYAAAPSPSLFLTELRQDASSSIVMTGSNTQGFLNIACDIGSSVSIGDPISQWSDLGSPSSCSSSFQVYCFASD